MQKNGIAGLARAIVVVAIGLGGCGSTVTSRPRTAASPPKIIETEVTARIEGTAIVVEVSKVTKCTEGESSGCGRVPLANLGLTIADRGSGTELGTLQTGADGRGQLDLAPLAEAVLLVGDDQDVLLNGRPKASIDVSEVRGRFLEEKNARDAERSFEAAQAAAERGDWPEAQRAAERCVRLSVNHVDCAHVAKQAGEALHAEEAEKQQTNAIAAQRERRWQNALDAATRCLAAAPDRSRCADVVERVKPKAADAMARRAKELLDEGNLPDALQQARACLQAVPGFGRCQDVVADVEGIYGSAQRVKDFTVYREGDGYLVYFNVVSSDGKVVDLPGKAQVALIAQSSGVDVSGWLAATWSVTQASYKPVTLGVGGFERTSVVASQWFARPAFYERSPIPANALGIFMREYDMVVQLRFTDVFGRKFEAQDDFSP